jgi:hypothetical protein
VVLQLFTPSVFFEATFPEEGFDGMIFEATFPEEGFDGMIFEATFPEEGLGVVYGLIQKKYN